MTAIEGSGMTTGIGGSRPAVPSLAYDGSTSSLVVLLGYV